MKIAIIGAGNMGGAIARGLAQGDLIETEDIWVSNPSAEKLRRLKAEYPALQITHNNAEAALEAELVILAVKPWLIESVVRQIPLTANQQLVSVAAGISFKELAHFAADGRPELNDMTIFRLIPNTAVSELQSMTLISSHRATPQQEQFLLDLFDQLGLAMLIPEDKITAATSLASCGIAYALKYIQAAMQAGIEMGIYPKDAMRMVAQSVKGAAELILNNDTHPSPEIDKVCTPGGLTIKGVNELEHNGFTSAIIQAMKASR